MARSWSNNGERSYKIAFLILTAFGGLMLAAASLFDYRHTGQTATFSGFPLGAIVCLFVASLSYSKYLSVRKSNVPNDQRSHAGPLASDETLDVLPALDVMVG